MGAYLVPLGDLQSSIRLQLRGAPTFREQVDGITVTNTALANKRGIVGDNVLSRLRKCVIMADAYTDIYTVEAKIAHIHVIRLTLEHIGRGSLYPADREARKSSDGFSAIYIQCADADKISDRTILDQSHINDILANLESSLVVRSYVKRSGSNIEVRFYGDIPAANTAGMVFKLALDFTRDPNLEKKGPISARWDMIFLAKSIVGRRGAGLRHGR